MKIHHLELQEWMYVLTSTLHELVNGHRATGVVVDAIEDLPQHFQSVS